MTTTLRFISSTLADVKAQRVFWKVRWADPWTLMSPKLWCNAAQWTAAPSLPVAELHWRYGIGLEIGQQQFAARFKESNRLRQYVKVEYDTFALEPQATDPLRWYGTVEIELDDFQGVVQRAVGGNTIAFASGKNFMTCLGLESLLDTAFVTTSVVAKADGSVVRVNRALDFNGGGIWNMSNTPGPDGVYVFASTLEGASPWSSWAITNYLLKYHTPKDFNGQAMLPFELGGIGLGALSTWDTPDLPAQGKSVRELLNVLLPRQRLTGWSLQPEDVAGGKLVVTPFTMTATDLALMEPPALPLPANILQYRIATEKDRGRDISIKRSTADACDQVVVRGARRTSTATFSFYDGTLAKGWADALETAFEQGASLASDYPAAAEVDDRMFRNEQARAADKFDPVYQRFVLPPTFQDLVGDGMSGQPTKPLAPSDDDPAIAVPLAAEDRRFTVELALQQGFEYESLPATEIEAPPHRQAKPLVLYPRSDSTTEAPRYRQLDAVGVGAERPDSVEAGDLWSARVRVDADDGALWLDLEGEHPEDFAAADFTRLDVDEDPALLGSADFRKMLCTLSVEWSDYARGVYPPSAAPGRDLVRIFPIDAGEEYRADYLCPQTIVALKPETGELVRCAAGGYARDDRKQLEAIALAAYSWYSVTRRSVVFKTSLLNSSLQIGSYITAIGDEAVQGDVHTEDINAVVTSMEIRSPSVEGEGNVQPAVPTIAYETAFGELDVLKFS